ncbi:MAG TPA: tyrosine-type recombinase/integrase [Oligoflexus sp.]|uniref:tyrosine-type recombinase/integrase n=1 Tax=Oligoflexus sp. TaxID=1971216 RepID=UPI002D6134B2|nr:tyrosine-type recombinase/integrase [Oligoflexus sp.]HYX36895.1 tyrosine-type recombinase/integrase [Oligoflexus sp.]
MAISRSNPNHPKKGSATKTQPIRRFEDIRAIKRFLAGDPRNLAIFTLGINSALRGVDILRLKIEQVQYLKPGDSFDIREKKTGKYRRVMLNKVSHKALQDWIQSVAQWEEGDRLFPSKKAKGRLLVPTLMWHMIWMRSCHQRIESKYFAPNDGHTFAASP